MIYRETAEEYHARQAISAGFLWDMVKPDGCPSYAFARSVFNPKPLPQKKARELDVGTAAHLAVLEPELLEKRTHIIAADSYHTKEAKGERDLAIFNKRVPLLALDYELVIRLRDAIEHSAAAELLFGEGESEVSYTWETSIGWMAKLPEVTMLPCKARADRITPLAIVDLKTAASASPDAFQRAMWRDGHHLRAAWYIDGLREQKFETELLDYLFVVVAKEPPHLVEVNRIEPESLALGRTQYRQALREFRRARETGVWSGHSREADNNINTVALPAFAKNLLYAQERAGAFDADEDIPY